MNGLVRLTGLTLILWQISATGLLAAEKESTTMSTNARRVAPCHAGNSRATGSTGFAGTLPMPVGRSKTDCGSTWAPAMPRW